jgi:surface antigen
MDFKLALPITLALLAGCASGPERPSVMNAGHGTTGPSAGEAEEAALMASLSDADRAFMTRQIDHTLETAPARLPVTWQNPDGGADVTLTVTHMFQQADNSYCRDFTETLATKGHSQTIRATACRRTDGTWQMTG